MKRLFWLLALLVSTCAPELARAQAVPRLSPPGVQLGPWLPAINVASMPANSGCINAKGDGVTDDAPSINCAISYASSLTTPSGFAGARIAFPCGDYLLRSTITVPPQSFTSITLQGSGMRCTYLRPAGPTTNFTATGTGAVPATVLIGPATPDAAGTFTNVVQYIGWEDLSINGSQLTGGGNVRAVALIECQKCWMKNAIVESFPNSSVGLYLRGSTITGGLGTGTSAPHTWRNSFYNVIVATIGTGAASTPSALVIQNGDENDFYNCNFAVTAGLTPGADAILDVKIELGRNNRFFGALYSGDVTAGKTNYVALKFGPPVNEAGVANGSVLQNQDYGMVGEGFDRVVWFGGDNSGNTLGNVVYNANPSIFNTAFLDDNPALAGPGQFQGGGSGGNAFYAPLANIMYQAVSLPAVPMGVFSASATTPAVGGADVWKTANGSATIITDFLAPSGAQLSGRLLTIFCNDENTTIRDVNNGGGGHIRNFGRRDIVCHTGAAVEYRFDGGALVWVQVAPAAGYTGSTYTDIPFALTCGAGTTPAIDVTQGNYFTCNITANVAVVVAVPSNRPPAGGSERIRIALRNSSGGALTTAPTFNAGANGFKFTGTCNPANATQCVWDFVFDPVQSFWYQVGGTPTGL